MKKFLAYSALGFLGLFPFKPAFANLLNVTFDGSNYTVQKLNTSTGTTTDLKSFTSPYGTCAGCTFVDEYNGKLYLGGANGFAVYDVESNTVEYVDKPAGSLIQRVFPWSGDSIISEKKMVNYILEKILQYLKKKMEEKNFGLKMLMANQFL